MSKTAFCGCLLLSALTSVANAATKTTAPPTQPGIAFVGDWLTVGWAAYIPGNALGNCCIDANTAGTVTLQQEIVAAISQKPAFIHIMIGSDNANRDDDSTFATAIPAFETELSEAITQVEAAHIQPILGIEPAQFSFNPQVLLQLDAVVYSMGAKYGVPVINYNGAFNGTASTSPGVGGTAQAIAWEQNSSLITAPLGTNLPTPGALGPGNPYTPLTPSYAGYTVMTLMMQTEVATLGAQPKSVYLQDEEQANATSARAPVANVNTVAPGVAVQFYPVASYGSSVMTQAIDPYCFWVTGTSAAQCVIPYLNSDFITGSTGTWTSSNPLVGFVNQYGQFWAFNQGSTIIKFTLPNGVWNEWVMYVN
jgi:hypothetical protein